VKFDFDVCSYKLQLLKSLDSFDVGDELGHIVDQHVSPIVKDTIFAGDVALINEIKSFVLGKAKTKANKIKTSISDLIENFSCSRRLDEIDIDHDGPQRLLQPDQTFGLLVDQILNFTGVQSASAGFDLARMEVSLDVAIRFEEVFGVSSLQSALNRVLDKLSLVQAVFGANTDVTAVDNLLRELECRAYFWLSISAGAKVNATVADVFNSLSTGIAPPLGGFLRINEFGASVHARVADLDLELFPEIINITDAAMELSIGVGLRDPYEFVLDSANSQIGIGYDEIVTGRLRFEPFGSLAASFSFSTTVGGIRQNLSVLFDDGDLFDEEEVTVAVNFNACRFLPAFEQMLAKLGSVGLSPDNILGPNAVRGIVLESLDDLFPDIGGFLSGVLEGE
jgi:hypothetical protein